jgi:serine protease Do
VEILPKEGAALIRIVAPHEFLPVAPIGDSDTIQEGEWVFTIGDPFASVNTGILSAKGSVLVQGPYIDFLQTDAEIREGDGGGPLLNLHGEIIGITSSIVKGEKIGFVVPVNIIKEPLRRAVKSYRYPLVRPYLNDREEWRRS